MRQACSHIFILILLPILFFYPQNINSQEIVDVEYQGGIGKILIELSLARIGVNRSVENDVDVYKVRYTTRNVTGGIDTASGQMVLPVFRDKTMPVLVYHHGTVGSRNDVPSNFDISTQNEAQIGLIYASFGYATLAPDYIGLGDSPGFHPYVHAESEAWSAIDMIIAFKKYAEEESIPLNDQLFTCGYSQGGHAAMATHMVLQRDFGDVLEVTASAPMSGPYNISGGMADFTISDEEYDLVSYVVYVVLSYQLMYPDMPQDLSAFFKPQYIDDIVSFKNEQINLWELNDRLRSILIAQTGGSFPKFMLQDSIIEIINAGIEHPINAAIKDNDLYDWVPNAPVRMYYCKADEQVVYTNATFTDSIMNANGAQDVMAINNGDDLNHGGCFFPSIEASIDFFNSLRETTSDTREVSLEEIASIYPNPANSVINIAQKTEDILQARIYNLSGSLIINQNYPDKKINIASLNPGMYILNLRTDSKVSSTKLVIQ